MTPEQFIERVGRTCYKSEDKITEESAPKFVRNLINRGHEAMIEHWSLIFRVKRVDFYRSVFNAWTYAFEYWAREATPEDSFVPKIRFTNDCDHDHYVVSGNIRSWRDFIRLHKRNGGFVPNFLYEVALAAPTFFDDLITIKSSISEEDRWLSQITVKDLISDFEHMVHHDVTLKFVCDRGVSHELVRHRAASFAQESTRYCDYSNGKHGAEITVVRPSWCVENSSNWYTWKGACKKSEAAYMALIVSGAAPQEARAVLPNSLKTEVIVTGTIGHWMHFFDLRCAPDAQPDMREVACMARDLLGGRIRQKALIRRFSDGTMAELYLPPRLRSDRSLEHPACDRRL
jgi:thymidylate synthase (FAD)